MGRTSDGGALGRQWAITALTLGGFVLTGLSALPEPPVRHPGHLLAWWAGHPPAVGALSLLRLGALVCSTYWFVLCTSVIVLSRTGQVLRPAWLKLPGLGRVLKVAAGGSLLGVAVISAAGCAGTGGGPPAAGAAAGARPPELLPLGEVAPPAKASPAKASPAKASPSKPPPVTPPLLQPTPAISSAVTAPLRDPPRPTSAAATTTTTTTTSWTVRPGDDLWSISESVLIARLGHLPGQSEIAALWLKVIDANRANLPDPANPSLIFAGDVVTIPA